MLTSPQGAWLPKLIVQDRVAPLESQISELNSEVEHLSHVLESQKVSSTTTENNLRKQIDEKVRELSKRVSHIS